VLELTGLAQGVDQTTDDVVELEQRVLVRMLGRRLPEEALVRVVVEMRAARAVVEEPRLAGAGLVP
jgi:hypothetical protein